MLVLMFMLVGGFLVAPLGPLNNVCVVMCLLGNPVNTLDSLIVKAEAVRRVYAGWVEFPPTVLCMGEREKGKTKGRRGLEELLRSAALFGGWCYGAPGPGVYDQISSIHWREGRGRRN
jgi:hypothetical protein